MRKGYWTGKNRPSPSLETREKLSKALMGHIGWGRGKKLSIEHRKKVSEALKGKPKSVENTWSKPPHYTGEKSSHWKGGITPINKKIRQSLEYRLWRESVFERDNWTCQECEIRGIKLHAHHIKPFAYFPELRFAIDNGTALCENCHSKTDSYKKKTLTISSL